MGFRIECKKEENLKKILVLFNDNQKMAFLEIYELPVEIPRLFWYLKHLRAFFVASQQFTLISVRPSSLWNHIPNQSSTHRKILFRPLKGLV